MEYFVIFFLTASTILLQIFVYRIIAGDARSLIHSLVSAHQETMRLNREIIQACHELKDKKKVK